MLRRLLVANRGEIARRLIRGAHDAGCEAVAVYAGDDASSPHVREADLAVLLPGAALSETYLSADALVGAAVRAGADALHPGYGFLSENPALPEACAASGIVWVGPPAEAMRFMGHKARAKDLVARAGVPILPSAVVEPGAGGAALDAAAAEVGYPLLVKASAGGGGRGMRLVRAPGELGEAVAAAQREAAAAFGSDEVFLERYLEAPRHVEVQIIGDTHGSVLHLLDRECSVQRRHQKVVEEAPAVLVPDATRRRMWDAAVAVGHAVGYTGAGTVEFLADADKFFFLEMNTRLQVEHGVTELVTGVDIVGLQLTVAAGQPLPLRQDDVVAHGHAVEVRLCAERPREDYRPTPGTVTHVRWPEGLEGLERPEGPAWPGLRIDRAIESGSIVSPAYDSLVAKVMAHDADRGSTVARLSRALRALELDGLETNRDLLGAVLDDAGFLVGDVTVQYLDGRPDLRDASLSDDTRHRHAAAAGFCLTGERAAQSLVPVRAAGWRNIGEALHADHLTDAVGSVEVRAPLPSEPASILVDGEWRAVGTATTDGPIVDLVAADGLRRRYTVRVSARGVAVDVNGPEGQSSFVRRDEDDAEARGGVAGECRAPLPGAVTKVLVAEGDVVGEGDGLIVLEAMKMEHTLRANGAGTVVSVACAPGQQVNVHDVLVTVEPV